MAAPSLFCGRAENLFSSPRAAVVEVARVIKPPRGRRLAAGRVISYSAMTAHGPTGLSGAGDELDKVKVPDAMGCRARVSARGQAARGHRHHSLLAIWPRLRTSCG